MFESPRRYWMFFRRRIEKVSDVELEREMGRDVDKTGGMNAPVYAHSAIEEAEARAFGRRRRKTPSPLVVKRRSS